MPNSGISIPERMGKIRGIFEAALQAANDEPHDNRLIPYLETTDRQFRSIAYEGAAMSRALTDLDSGSILNLWRNFSAQTPAHSVQVQIGLGWAMAQRQAPIQTITESFSPIGKARILDGCGYYDGMLRQRLSIRSKALPNMSGTDLHAYDQGLGRSLWYVAKGDITTVVEMAATFIDSRQSDLWRGIGIAVAYVGGCDEAMLRSLYELAGGHRASLASGAALLARARAHADTADTDSELACQIWCQLTAVEAVAMMDRTMPVAANEDAYYEWMKKIEDKLINRGNSITHDCDDRLSLQ